MKHKSDFASRLCTKLDLVYRSYEVYASVFPSKDEAPSWYKNYLLTTHSIIRASVPLMQAAYDRCGDGLQKERDLLHELREYYKKHIQEEMNHDEWLLDDLESIGVPRCKSLSKRPSQAVAELVGSQYYWIFHWHPVSLLGYILYLEGNPSRKEEIDKLREVTGFPGGAFRTMVKHSDLDPHHRDELNELLESLPLTTEHEEWITSNCLNTANRVIDIMYQVKPMDAVQPAHF
jgi:pyrroloquinoline quinone (PQQ) biosynthesis protein C